MKKIELEIVALSHSITQTHSYAVVLGEVNGLRRLPIVIGGFEAQAIAVALEKMHPSRPLTHDLMKNFMNAFAVDLQEIIICDLQEGIFYSKLICVSEHDTVEIDSRTSDALALAVRFGCPVYTYENILESAGILMEDSGKKKKGEEVAVTNESTGSEDLRSLSVDELNTLLNEVLEQEDYLRAIAIRDELNTRKKKEPIYMVIFPHCKINIGLKVVRKRADGYHDLQTIFYPLPVKDVLELIEAPAGAETSINIFGLSIQGQTADNLCLKAYHLLKKDFPELPAVGIYLYKNIPMGAGLGGGSSDGAFTLLLLNEKYKLEIPQEKLIQYALKLGSDCPFFILNQPAYAEGRGEQLEPFELDLSPYSFLLVNSGIHVSTAAAFSQILPAIPQNNLKTLVSAPVAEWKNRVNNDFEGSVFAQYPVLKEIKETLYNKGALYASMTGTGSTIYGIFEKNRLPADLFDGKYRTNRVG